MPKGYILHPQLFSTWVKLSASIQPPYTGHVCVIVLSLRWTSFTPASLPELLLCLPSLGVTIYTFSTSCLPPAQPQRPWLGKTDSQVERGDILQQTNGRFVHRVLCPYQWRRFNIGLLGKDKRQRRFKGKKEKKKQDDVTLVKAAALMVINKM